jgi:hypothetical protein
MIIPRENDVQNRENYRDWQHILPDENFGRGVSLVIIGQKMVVEEEG